MKVLFFDDEEWRLRSIVSRSTGAAIEWARDVKEAEEALKNAHFDVVCLDHDIGGAMLTCSSGCGCCVARSLVLQPARHSPNVVIVHSWNHDAATRMVGILDGIFETIKAPFGSFHFNGKEVIIKTSGKEV